MIPRSLLLLATHIVCLAVGLIFGTVLTATDMCNPSAGRFCVEVFDMASAAPKLLSDQ